MGRGQPSTKAVASALVALRGVDESDPEALRHAVGEATDGLAEALEGTPHFSQTEAASLLEVSRTTLDNWVDKGLLPLHRVAGYKRPRVAAKPLLDLAAEVKELRRMGQKRGLLAEALSRLEAEDATWRQEFEELQETERRSFERDDYVSARPDPGWDPED